MKRLLLSILIILFATTAFGASPYYVNCGDGGSNVGTFANPFNSLASLETYSSTTGFADGDDIYFASGVTCTLTDNDDRIQIRHSGVDTNNRTIIGCYDGENDFDCGAVEQTAGSVRAIIDGGNFTYPGANQAVIETASDSSYVTIREIKFQNFSGGNTGDPSGSPRAWKSKGADYVYFTNNHIYRGGDGVEIAAHAVDNGSEYCEVTGNLFQYIGYPDYPDGTGYKGAVIEISSVDRGLGLTNHILVAHNTIENGTHEGIGAYKQSDSITIEYNTVRDVRSYHIYIGSSKNCIVRYNLVYESTDDLGWGQSENAIFSDIESWRTSVGSAAAADTWNGNNEFYGNMVAGMQIAIGFSCNINAVSGYEAVNCHDSTLVYNNTLVDNDISFFNGDNNASDSIEIKNNISYHTYAGGQVHANNDSPNGTTWATNLFNNTDDTVTGDADASNVSTSAPGLVKTSSWVGQAPEAFDQDDFQLSNTSSPAYNTGTTLGSPYNSDYWGTARPQVTYYDIGAHEYEGIAPPPVDYGKTKILRGTLK